MRHARSDYNRIQDPAVNDPSLCSEGSSPIGEDEPVFLVRGQDKAAYATVLSWAEHAAKLGASPEIVAAAKRHATVIAEWQVEHGNKIADAPSDVLK